MDAVALLRQALAAGLVIRGDGTGRLHVAGPKRLATLVQQLHQHKDAVLDVWEVFEERAAIMEYDGSLPREEAERLAWDCLCGEAVAISYEQEA
jgi:hypothetical protein